MDNTKDEGSANRPHVLDDTNYDFWKVQNGFFPQVHGQQNIKGCYKRLETHCDHL